MTADIKGLATLSAFLNSSLSGKSLNLIGSEVVTFFLLTGGNGNSSISKYLYIVKIGLKRVLTVFNA